MQNEKKEVGHNYTIPEGYKERARIGGYGIATDGKHLYICGNKVFNLTAAPIEYTCISPLTRERADEVMSSKPGYIGTSINLKPNTLYYVVFYDDNGYVFFDFDTANQFLATLVQVKAGALIEKLAQGTEK